MTRLSGALQDLAEAHAGTKREAAFRRRLVQLMARHGRRGAWVTRLTKAGYMGADAVSDGSSDRLRCRTSEARRLASCEASLSVRCSLAANTAT
jgi:hypothetical protein